MFYFDGDRFTNGYQIDNKKLIVSFYRELGRLPSRKAVKNAERGLATTMENYLSPQSLAFDRFTGKAAAFIKNAMQTTKNNNLQAQIKFADTIRIIGGML